MQIACVSGLALVTVIWVFFSAKWKLDSMIKLAQTDSFNYESVDETGIGSSASLEKYVARVLQALVFDACFQLSSYLGDKYFWKHLTSDRVILFIFYILLFITCGFFLLPQAVFTATVTLALPPYVDPDNFKVAEACTKHKEHQESSAALVDKEEELDMLETGVPTMSALEVEEAAPDTSAVVDAVTEGAE